MSGKIYDFSFYVKKKTAADVAAEIASAFERVNTPGTIIEIKQKIGIWIELKNELSRLPAVA